MSTPRSAGNGTLVAGVIVLLSSALLAAGWTLALGDWVARNAEMARLLHAIEGSEAAMIATQDEIVTLLDEHSDDPQGTALRADLSDAAARGRDAIAAEGRQVGAVQVLPWHGALAQAKAAYLAHNQAWQSYLDRASTDPAELVTPQPLVDSSFETAEPLLRAAVPLLDLWDFATRIDVIYTPPEAPAGDDLPGQQVRFVYSTS